MWNFLSMQNVSFLRIQYACLQCGPSTTIKITQYGCKWNCVHHAWYRCHLDKKSFQTFLVFCQNWLSVSLFSLWTCLSHTKTLLRFLLSALLKICLNTRAWCAWIKAVGNNCKAHRVGKWQLQSVVMQVYFKSRHSSCHWQSTSHITIYLKQRTLDLLLLTPIAITGSISKNIQALLLCMLLFTHIGAKGFDLPDEKSGTTLCAHYRAENTG